MRRFKGLDPKNAPMVPIAAQNRLRRPGEGGNKDFYRRSDYGSLELISELVSREIKTAV